MLPFTLQQENDDLEPVHSTKHDNTDQRELRGHPGDDRVHQVHNVTQGCRLYKGSEQIHENNESHREAAETTHLPKEEQFEEVVHRRVDPTCL